MGNLIGILSTVILVSTVSTLIFAVGAYVISRKGRNGVGTMDEDSSSQNESSGFAEQAPMMQHASPTLFKQRRNDSASESIPQPTLDDDYEWK